MRTWSIELRLNRAPNPAEIDALYDAGLGDAGVESGAVGVLQLDREAPDLLTAITSALAQVERVPGLRVVALVNGDAVTLREIASRTTRTYESVRLLAQGKRGPGGFPGALVDPGAGWTARVYSWDAVAGWLIRNLGEPVPAPDPLISAIDQALRLRAHLLEVDEVRAAQIRTLLSA